METAIKQFYEKPNGTFGLVEIRKEDKDICDNLVGFLTRLEVHSPINRELLRGTWKNYNKTNVRKFLQP